MLTIFSKGILLGISLSFMVGPLLFTIIESSLTKGFRAGMAVAAGMWVSDFVFIGLVIFGIENFTALTQHPSFYNIAAKTGGSILCLFGVIMFLKSHFFSKKMKKTGATASNTIAPADNRQIFQLWLYGLFFNTINPGTIFFWVGIAAGYVLPNRLSSIEMATFFGGMMLTLTLTDTLKVLSAKKLQQFLTPQHILIISKIIALILFVFGGTMFLKKTG